MGIEKFTKRITIYSSCGEWEIRRSTEQILNNTTYNYGEKMRDKYWIRKFDTEEYRKHYAVENLPNTIDILDIGYWYGGVEEIKSSWQFEPADKDWRKEIKQQQ